MSLARTAPWRAQGIARVIRYAVELASEPAARAGIHPGRRLPRPGERGRHGGRVVAAALSGVCRTLSTSTQRLA